MVTQQQRQRALARAKWERQQERRTADASRRRRIAIVVGVVVGLLVIAGLVWLFASLANNDEAPEQQPTVPVNTELSPQLNPLPTDQLPPPRETQPVEGPEGEGQQEPTPTPGKSS
ncbi:MAG: hypothetical protein H0V49_12150 [Nocardioidaceae bacterium]|nr:hypothetical protein [Nocardioidaceae bacterium]